MWKDHLAAKAEAQSLTRVVGGGGENPGAPDLGAGLTLLRRQKRVRGQGRRDLSGRAVPGSLELKKIAAA